MLPLASAARPRSTQAPLAPPQYRLAQYRLTQCRLVARLQAVLLLVAVAVMVVVVVLAWLLPASGSTS